MRLCDDADIAARVLFVSHEASLTGAPLVLLEFLRWLRSDSSIEPHVLLLKGGELESEFAALAPTTLVAPRDLGEHWTSSLLRRAAWDDPLGGIEPPDRGLVRTARGAVRESLRRRLRRTMGAGADPDLVYLNSAASAPALALIDPAVPVLAHVHEMGETLETIWQRAPLATEWMRERTVRYIAVSEAVRSTLVALDPGSRAEVVVIHEPLRPERTHVTPAAIDDARRALGLGPQTQIVGCVAALNWRKGPDLYLQVARRTLARMAGSDVRFLWLGPSAAGGLDERQTRFDIRMSGLGDHVLLVPPTPDPRPVMSLFDVFALTSREDPFPLACLEAAAMRKPIVCFASGGMSEFLQGIDGLVIPQLDADAMARRIVGLLSAPEERKAIGDLLAARVYEGHRLDVIAPALMGAVQAALGARTGSRGPARRP